MHDFPDQKYVVSVPAEIIHESSSDDVTLQEGDTVVLTCNVTGIPPPQVTWYRRPSSAAKIVHHHLDRLRKYTVSEAVLRQRLSAPACSETKRGHPLEIASAFSCCCDADRVRAALSSPFRLAVVF